MPTEFRKRIDQLPPLPDVQGDDDVPAARGSVAGRNKLSAIRDWILASPNLTDIPLAPTASPNNASTQVATTAYVDAAVAVMQRGHIDGMKILNDTGDATNDIDVAVGVAVDSTNTSLLVIDDVVVKQIDVEFAEYSVAGTPSGGRAAADNLTGAKWFHVYIIGGVGKNPQPFLATSSDPTLPTGFTLKRRIGSVHWTGSAIRPFVQTGDDFFFVTAVQDRSSTSAAAWALLSLMVPSNVPVKPYLSGQFTQGTAGVITVGIGNGSDTGQLNEVLLSRTALAGDERALHSAGEVVTNSGQIHFRTTIAAGTIVTNTLLTRGWRDSRGKDAN